MPNIFLIEKSFGKDWKLCCYTQWAFKLPCILLEGRDIRHLFPAFRDGQRQGTIAKPKLVMQDEDIAVLAAILFDHVYPGLAKIDAALSYTDHDIPRALKDDTQLWDGWNLCLILARIGLEHTQSRGRQKIERVDFKATFGWEGESDCLSCLHR